MARIAQFPMKGPWTRSEQPGLQSTQLHNVPDERLTETEQIAAHGEGESP
jgi:hypothetical protein